MVNDYRDWGIQLGRRFRALKLWFVIRSFGIEGLQAKLRSHIRLAQELAGDYVIRVCIGQTGTEARHVNAAWDLIQACARSLAAET